MTHLESIAPDRHAIRWSEARKSAAERWLAVCDEPPTEPSHEQAVRALGRHIPCPVLYADQAMRSESMAQHCRQRGTASDVLFAKCHAGWGRFWRLMEAQARQRDGG